MKGRKNIPVELKKIRGTYRNDRDSGIVKMNVNLSKLPNPPKWLYGTGLDYYNIEGKKLLSQKRLHEFDLPLFLSICRYITKLEEYAIKEDEATDINEVKSYKKLYDETQNRLRLSMCEFGITQASANKIKGSESEDVELLEFQKKFMNGNNR